MEWDGVVMIIKKQGSNRIIGVGVKEKGKHVVLFSKHRYKSESVRSVRSVRSVAIDCNEGSVSLLCCSV